MGKLRFSEDSSRDSKRKPIPSKKLLYVYKTVAQIINKALNQEGTLRNLVYEHAKTLVKTHLRLAIEVVRHRNLLEKLVSETGLAKKENLDADLAQVLVYELVLGERKELPQGLEIFDQVTAYQDRLQKALHKAEKSADFKQLVVNKPEASVPRYGRVNTLLTDLESVVSNLQKRGFSLIDLEGKTYEEFLDCVRNLQDKEFVLDFHFPKDLLVFNPRQVLANLFVHKAGHLVIQDKTSYFPVACLGAPPGSVVLDACAAPGMKTIHIAAKMNNQGILFATDNNTKSLQKLDFNLNTYGVQCCQTSYNNFLSLNPKEAPFSNTEYILLDVPCSHSGNRSSEMQSLNVDHEYTPERLKAISGLQYRMLSHALKFPKVKRIVYTTTSTQEDEDEKVLQDVMSKNPDSFKLARAFPEWHIRGSPDYPFAEFCVRSRPSDDATIGCFVVVLERMKNGPEHVPSFSTKSTDLVAKLPFQAFIDRVGNRREQPDRVRQNMLMKQNAQSQASNFPGLERQALDSSAHKNRTTKKHRSLTSRDTEDQSLDEGFEEIQDESKKKRKKHSKRNKIAEDGTQEHTESCYEDVVLKSSSKTSKKRNSEDNELSTPMKTKKKKKGVKNQPFEESYLQEEENSDEDESKNIHKSRKIVDDRQVHAEDQFEDISKKKSSKKHMKQRNEDAANLSATKGKKHKKQPFDEIGGISIFSKQKK